MAFIEVNTASACSEKYFFLQLFDHNGCIWTNYQIILESRPWMFAFWPRNCSILMNKTYWNCQFPFYTQHHSRQCRIPALLTSGLLLMPSKLFLDLLSLIFQSVGQHQKEAYQDWLTSRLTCLIRQGLDWRPWGLDYWSREVIHGLKGTLWVWIVGTILKGENYEKQFTL